MPELDVRDRRKGGAYPGGAGDYDGGEGTVGIRVVGRGTDL